MKLFGCVSLFLLTAVVCLADESPTEEQFREQIRSLEKDPDSDIRINAARWLNRYAQEYRTEAAAAALTRSMKSDSDVAVRSQSLTSLAMLRYHREEPCPMAIVVALFDDEEDVRNHAFVYAGMFKRFPQEASAFLLERLKAQPPLRRPDYMYLLAKAGKSDPKALAYLRECRDGSDLHLRHAAHSALYTATKELKPFVSYLLRLAGDPDSEWPIKALPDDATEEQQIARVQRNLFVLGAEARLYDLTRDRPKDYASVLQELLRDPSPKLRRQTARIVARIAQAGVQPPEWWSEDSTLFPEEKKTPTLYESVKKSLLSDGRLEGALTTLQKSDPDVAIRKAADEALSALTTLKTSPKPEPKSPFQRVAPSLYTPAVDPELWKGIQGIDPSQIDGKSNTTIPWEVEGEDWGTQYLFADGTIREIPKKKEAEKEKPAPKSDQ